MKPAPFAYERPRSVEAACRILATRPDAKAIAGGQTLGPMLNLRLVQPGLLVDIARLEELCRVERRKDGTVFGALVTHAAIEDGRVVDPTRGFLAGVAKGIAYRAVRTRGTMGGSLAHADPAADWLSCLLALRAEVLIVGAEGRRRTVLADFVQGAMTTDLRTGELIEGIFVPQLSPHARTGFYKLCRKTGEFADAIGVVVHDPDADSLRFVSGATIGRPVVIDDPWDFLPRGAAGQIPSPDDFDLAAAERRLERSAAADDWYMRRVHAVALKRALERAHRP